jgi:hypothetical protein
VLGDALLYAAALIGFAAFALAVGSFLGRWIAVRRSTKHCFYVGEGKLWEKYRQILRLDAGAEIIGGIHDNQALTALLTENRRLMVMLRETLTDVVVRPLEEEQESVHRRLEAARQAANRLGQDPLFDEPDDPTPEDDDFLSKISRRERANA